MNALRMAGPTGLSSLARPRSACAPGVVVVLALAWAALLLVPAAAGAQIFVADSPSDSGPGTLRETITQSNNTPAPMMPNQIVLLFITDTTITVGSALPTITMSDLGIVGANTVVTTVDGSNVAPGTPVLAIDADRNVRLLNLIVADGEIAIGTGSTLTLESGSRALTYASEISGAGSLIVDGASEITLSGGLTYTGSTSIFNTRLTLIDQEPTGPIAIDASGELKLMSAGNPLTYAAPISGGGALIVDGDSEITLTGDLSFTGPTSIFNTRLTLIDQALVGTVTVDTTGELAVDVTTGSLDFGANIVGGGLFIKEGLGRLVLGGSNTIPEMRIDEGTLVADVGSLAATVTLNNGDLEIDQPTTGTLDSSIESDVGGLVTKRGVGILRIVSDAGAGADPPLFRVEEGTLRLVDGTLPNGVEVASGAILDGTGMINGTNGAMIEAGGILEPKILAAGLNAIEILTSTLTLASGSITRVAIDPDGGNQTRVRALDIVIEDGAVIEARAVAADYSTTQSTVILLADNSLSVTPSMIVLDTSQPLLEFSLRRMGEDLYLDVVRTSNAQSIGRTPNQRHVAAALNDLFDTMDPDVVDVRQGLDPLTTKGLRRAFDVLGGEVYGAFATARLIGADRIHRSIERRFRADPIGWHELATSQRGRRFFDSDIWYGSRGVGLPSLAGPRLQDGDAVPSIGFGVRGPVPGESGFSAWADGYGAFTTLDGGGDRSDYESTGYGSILGIEHRWVGKDDPLASIEIGAAFGYSRAEIDTPLTDAEGTLDTYHGAAYAGVSHRRFHVGALARFGYSDIEVDRPLDLGNLQRSTGGETDGFEISGHVEGGLRFDVGRSLLLQPIAAFTITQLGQDAVKESGAGSVDLAVDSISTTSLQTRLGIDLSRLAAIDREFVPVEAASDSFGFEPALRLGWMHEFGDTERTTDARFVGAAPLGRFDVDTAETPRDRFYGGVGWTMRVGRGTLIALDYEVQFDLERVDHGLRAGLVHHF